jgi:hypothetical protein
MWMTLARLRSVFSARASSFATTDGSNRTRVGILLSLGSVHVGNIIPATDNGEKREGARRSARRRSPPAALTEVLLPPFEPGGVVFRLADGRQRGVQAFRFVKLPGCGSPANGEDARRRVEPTIGGLEIAKDVCGHAAVKLPLNFQLSPSHRLPESAFWEEIFT